MKNILLGVNQKGLAQILILVPLVLGLVAGLYLVSQSHILKSKASSEPVSFQDTAGKVLPKKDNIAYTVNPSFKVVLISTLTANNNPSASTSTSSSSATAVKGTTLTYQIAENPTDLGDKSKVAPPRPFTIDGMVVDYTLKDQTIGKHFIWVKFIGDDGKTTDTRSAEVDLVTATGSATLPAPTNLSVSCSGNQATFSWNAVLGAESYILRVNKAPFDDWANTAGGDFSKKGITSATIIATIDPAANYSWSVQPFAPGEKYPSKNPEGKGQFNCSTSPTPSSSPTTAGGPITFQDVYGKALPQTGGVPSTTSPQFKVVLTTTLKGKTTLTYKIAENQLDLRKGDKTYTQSPMIVDYTLQDKTLGKHIIWVKFTDIDGKSDIQTAKVALVLGVEITPSPIPSSTPTVTPTPDITLITGNGLNSPNSVVVVESYRHQAWVTNTNNSISIFNTDGTPVRLITGNGLNQPFGMVLVSDRYPHQVWVANANDSISRFNTDGTPIRNGTITGNGLSKPVGIALINNQVWVTNFGDQSISRFNTDGTPIDRITASPYLNYPRGIALINNQVWVTNRNFISIFNTDGLPLVQIAGNGLNYPYGIALINNQVWVTNFGDFHISIFDAIHWNNPKLLGSISGNGLSQPDGIAVAVNSNVWVVNGGSNSISVLDANAPISGSPSPASTTSN